MSSVTIIQRMSKTLRESVITAILVQCSSPFHGVEMAGEDKLTPNDSLEKNGLSSMLIPVLTPELTLN